MVGVSEMDPQVLNLLSELYPEAEACRDARQLAARTHAIQPRWVLAGWPCPPYSAAVRGTGRGSRDPVERDVDRWANTTLICDTLRSTFSGERLDEMPWGVLLENVPGLLQLGDNAPFLDMLLRCLCSLPVVWRIQLLCPHEHMEEGATRRRVIFAGVRVDLAVAAAEEGWREVEGDDPSAWRWP